MTLGVLACLLALNSIWRDGGGLMKKSGEEKKERWDYLAKSDHHVPDEHHVKKEKIPF